MVEVFFWLPIILLPIEMAMAMMQDTNRAFVSDAGMRGQFKTLFQ